MDTKDNLIIIMVDGGFCSQLVKYGLGEFLKKTRGVRVKYDVSWFEKNGLDCDGKHKRELLIHKVFPHIDFEIATDEEIQSARRQHYFINPNPYKFCPEILAIQPPAYLDGYYENVVYLNQVKDTLQHDLDFSKIPSNAANQAMLQKIQACDYACAVHIRRGDFINLGLAFLTDNYYVSAIEKIQQQTAKQVHFFFFSNDLAYVQEKIIPKCPGLHYTLVDINTNDTGYLDLYLISQCHAQIASNSSFGFWGAFLNPHADKCFVFPSEWIPNKDEIGFYASIAHHLPNTIVLHADGKEAVPHLISQELENTIQQFREKNPNYLIEQDPAKTDKICAIYFSSNGIFYPKDLKTFQEMIIQNNRFEWYKTRYEKAQKHIFVRDVDMCWYQHGINSSLNDMDKVFSFLKKQTQGYKVICIGSSAGGYAALAFACLLKAEKCFISSPCLDIKESILLNQKFIRLSEYNGPKYQNYIEHPARYNDILPLVQEAHPQVYYIYPMFSDIDKPEYQKLKDFPFVKTLSYASDVHGQPFSHALIKLLLNSSCLDDIFGNTYFSESQIISLFPKAKQFKYILGVSRQKKTWFFLKKNFWKQLLRLYRQIKQERNKNASHSH